MKIMIEYLAGRPVRTEKMGQMLGGSEAEGLTLFSQGPKAYVQDRGWIRPFRAGRSVEQARSIEQ